MTGFDQHPLPTMNSLAAKQAVILAKAQGIDASEYFDRIYQGGHLPTFISFAAQAQFLEKMADLLNDSALGLHLAEMVNPREVGLLFYAMSSAADVGKALNLLSRYYRIVNNGVRITVSSHPEETVMRVSYPGLPRHRSRQLVEFGMALLVRALRLMTEQQLNLKQISWLHGRNDRVNEFQRYFGCPIHFGAAADHVSFAPATIALPLKSGDPYLLATLKPFCDQVAAMRNTTRSPLSVMVENELARLLPHRKATAAHVARELGLSERTLSRRLAEENTSLASLLDEVRHSLALQYLNEPKLTLAQIAWLLGYAEATSFNHAFKRWTGQSPMSRRHAPVQAAG